MCDHGSEYLRSDLMLIENKEIQSLGNWSAENIINMNVDPWELGQEKINVGV